MRIEVINTGTELLLGSTLNTHLSWIGQQIFPLGLRVAWQTTVPDGSAIRRALVESAEHKTDLILVTGGLGPTSDDITRELIAEMLGIPLVPNEEVHAAILARCQRRGIALRESMLRQTMVPEGAVVLPNHNGTAPGLYLAARESTTRPFPHLLLLPGPPRELKPMFEDFVIPILRELNSESRNEEMRVYRVVGMGESAVEEVVGAEIQKSGDLEVGYCARPNEVDFRLIGQLENLDRWHEKILKATGENLVCLGEKSMEEVVIAQLKILNKKLAVAESCTGGLLASRLTDVPGASACFLGGFVTYANSFKIGELGVSAELIETDGAVSASVASAMAEGVLKKTGGDFALSTTGIAGPDGGSPEKPVGTIFIGLSERGGQTEVKKANFPSDRQSFKQLATQSALDLLRRRLIKMIPEAARSL